MNITIASNYFDRLVGLIGKSPLEEDEGLLITECNRVHTYFMKYAIDVLFLDKNMKIIAIQNNLLPSHISEMPKHAKHILEIKHQNHLFEVGMMPRYTFIGKE